ncbi:MAG TPA: tripartite tricarboxylate transporter permease [Stackebrandtia sp.]|jgi:putative tricarboxylic transport membrane protein|uniref:tripartite tricarboxylate transporter permease n=1 Tax=Stackebrandtia sp. TaxID=2023065 RepID=UPI002D57F4EF|nr:tripartite tricarboxylate transporter permease [Stackebrandtia sp.]HZE41446.1 tripartite tricarboxylate transporter permease [Stackebrandtia sp.]
MANLLGGFASVLTPENLLFAVIGVTVGTFVGILPGIGPALTIALLFPVANSLVDSNGQSGVVGSLIMFAGIYSGAMYGGSTTSILLNTPGESNSVVTAIEGHQMALRGRARAALASAAIGSFVAGTLSTLALTFFAEPLAALAINFRHSDFFALGVLATVSVTALVGRSLLRGMMSLTLGLLIGVIGIDTLTGKPRLSLQEFVWADANHTGVSTFMQAGIGATLVIVGLFAFGETLYVCGRLKKLPDKIAPMDAKDGEPEFAWMTKKDWRRSWLPWLRGTALGFPFGAMPAGGAEIPTFLSYTLEKARSKFRGQFGTGAIEGVAGPEAANNAAFAGVLVPLLTLGIPTSATAAIILASFKSFDVPVGIQLFDHGGAVVWALIASLYVGNIILLILNLPLIRIWVLVLRIPRPALYSAILVFAVVGVYANANLAFPLFLAIGIGVLAVFMRMYDFPISPVILGVIIGPLLEENFRKTMQETNNSYAIFVDRPLTVSLLALAVVSLILPNLPKIIAFLRGRRADKLSFADED